MFGGVSADDFGITYLAAALIPFCLLHRMNGGSRAWLLGLLAVCVFTAGLMVIVLNPSNDRASSDLFKVFFSPSHLVLAIFSGCGLVLVGSFVARPKSVANAREAAA